MTTGLRSVPFAKATACGNDFILIHTAHASGIRDRAAFTRAICDRHNGVGADGVEWLSPADDADVTAALLNSDGSAAEISGNGTRCVAAYWAEKHRVRQVTVRTGAGVKMCLLRGRSGTDFQFEMNLGPARVEPEIALSLASRSVRGIPVSTGNPHFVLFVDGFAPGWQAEAAEIGRHAHFPEGTNVELVKVLGPEEIEIRIFERGAGETQSSGTGACASAVAAIAAGRVQSPVEVRAPGGAQNVRWDSDVYLTGPARLLCEGVFFI